MLRWILSCFLAFSVLITGCSSNVSASASSSASPEAIASAKTTATPANPQAQLEAALAKFVQLKGKATVELKLSTGIVKIELDGDSAPVTAGNFADLVNRGHYNGLKFHRVVKDPSPFVAQGGDPLGNGTGSFIDPATSQPRYIPLEILPQGAKNPVYGEILPATQIPKLRHSKGAIAMARSQSPNSASCQFYFALDDIYFLDGSYAVFGYVTEGMDLVQQIKVGDVIESMTITQGAENIKAAK
ncbi:MAG: peptidylprolyl isomerase [Pseudanabaenaceae cyanobacterium bins.39]|nr:peptidylprolyl isomerase [Pseudanabaenaceae cyanobacterium bins.39]